jgi:hypothetical protein
MAMSPSPGIKQFRNAAITIAGIELMHRIRKGRFGLRRLGLQGRTASAVWNAVLQTHQAHACGATDLHQKPQQQAGGILNE